MPQLPSPALRAAAVLCCLVCLQPLAAAELLEARVAVADRSEAARGEAVVEGLARVLVRLSGRPLEELKDRLTGRSDVAANALTQFRYGAPESEGVVLTLSYDAQSVAEIAAELGLPYWSGQRPVILVWAVVDDGRRRFIDADSALAEQLVEHARYRGIPLMLPLFDLQDLTEVTPATVWLRDMSRLRQAAQRYAVRGLAAAYLQRAPSGNWSGWWQLEYADAHYAGEVTGHDGPDIGAALVDPMADALFAAYAHHPGGAGGTLMPVEVSGISSAGQYRSVWRYLQELDGVEAVIPERLSATGAGFRVRFAGAAEDFERQIALGRTLAPDATSAARPHDSAAAAFRYVGQEAR